MGTSMIVYYLICHSREYDDHHWSGETQVFSRIEEVFANVNVGYERFLEYQLAVKDQTDTWYTLEVRQIE